MEVGGGKEYKILLLQLLRECFFCMGSHSDMTLAKTITDSKTGKIGEILQKQQVEFKYFGSKQLDFVPLLHPALLAKIW